MSGIIDYLDFLDCFGAISGYDIEDDNVTLKYVLDDTYKERTISFDVVNGNKYDFFEEVLEEMRNIKDEEEREIFDSIIVLCRVRLINELQKRIDVMESSLKNNCVENKERILPIMNYYKEVLDYLNKSGELDLPLKYKDIGNEL